MDRVENSEVIFTEVKGYMTDGARTKIKMAESIYGIEVNVV